ncbi:MAG TPA: SurA N-terminal domain-containing protein [Thermoanaerobaculia bacterium]
MERPRRVLLSLVLLSFACLGPAAAQAPKPAAPAKPAAPSQSTQPGTPKLEDRVLAVVDEDPILASDLNRVIALGLKQPREGENETVFRRRVLNELIEERLRFHQIDRFGFEAVPVDEIDAQVAQIRGRFPDETAFQATLKEQGLTLKQLRQLVARQLMVLTYVDEQLGPRVFVSLDDINSYYQGVLTPEMQKRGQPVPPIEDVRDDIRTVLKERRLNEAIADWTEELRREADIRIYFDAPAEQLPPVVKRITSPP